MDEKMNVEQDPKVLLIADEKDGKLQAVTGMDDNGKIKTVKPIKKNEANFLTIDKNSNALENFFRNFMAQAQNPKHTGFYAASMNVLETLETLIRTDPNSKDLDAHRIDPKEYIGKEQSQTPDGEPQKQTYQPFDESKIDRTQLEKLGIKQEDFDLNLKAMLYGHKSPKVMDMNPILDGDRVSIKGRLSLEETPDGSLRITPHYCQSKPDLDVPFHGILFTPEDKEQLLKTGNTGHIIDLESVPGQKIPAYVSMDKLTNRIEALPTEKVTIPEKIKDAELSPEQQKALAEGKKVLVEGMTSRGGNQFDGYLQINASSKSFEFTYDGLDRHKYAQENKPSNQQNKEQGEVGEHKVRIPEILLGTELTSKQQSDLRENKTVYIQNMMKDGQDQPFDAYVKVNHEKGKLDFFKWNPEKSQSKEVKPAEGSKTQVVVNSEGKTNEATKNLNEPLKQGQTQPTEKQEENKQAQKQFKKSSGHKL